MQLESTIKIVAHLLYNECNEPGRYLVNDLHEWLPSLLTSVKILNAQAFDNDHIDQLLQM